MAVIQGAGQRNWSDSIKPPEMEFDSGDDAQNAAKPRSLPQTKCIWDLCIQATEKAERNAARGGEVSGPFLRPSLIFPGAIQESASKQSLESTLFVMGSKLAGKTSLILRFLDRDEQPKPTTALDYTFGRRSKGNNLLKDVAHVWELGGGIALSNLIEAPITKQCIRTLSVIIVVDLSKPETIWTTVETLLNNVKQRTKKVLAQLKQECPSEANMLVGECLARYGSDHPDKDNLDLIPIPLTIIGSKYDEFQNFDPEKKKIISKTLRFVAHYHGAHLCYFSSKIETLVMKTRGLLGHLVFKTQLSKSVSTDHNKPIYILAGMDAISQIGSPPQVVGSRSQFEQWKQLYLSTFPQEAEAAMPEHPCKDPKYNESMVDAVRSQKDEELERFKKQQERKMREDARKEGKLLKELI